MKGPSKGKGKGKGKGKKETDSLFNKFWESYPKKVSKTEARKCFEKALNHTTFEEILKAVTELKNWTIIERKDLQYIKNPTTWLNQGCWGDILTYTNHKKPYSPPPPKQNQQKVDKHKIEIANKLGIPVDQVPDDSSKLSQEQREKLGLVNTNGLGFNLNGLKLKIGAIEPLEFPGAIE